MPQRMTEECSKVFQFRVFALLWALGWRSERWEHYRSLNLLSLLPVPQLRTLSTYYLLYRLISITYVEPAEAVIH
jgi:hypothetical protein